MAGLFDHLSNLIARFRGKQEPLPAAETASVAARRLGLRSRPAPPPVNEINARSTDGAIADLRHAMAEADKRQARADTDASLLLAVLLTKGHGLSRAQALQLHDDLSRGTLREAD